MNYFSSGVVNKSLFVEMFTYIITNRDDWQRIYKSVCIYECLNIENVFGYLVSGV